jgi:eukaryotic-like serine/threonine-protein kinase
MIVRELGHGATGQVYVAEDAMLARAVAIKFVAKLDPGARQRFLLEARAVAKIHHPNVVEIYGMGTVENRPYFATELVRGESLDNLTKPVPWQTALDIAIGLARGLAAAHRRNVVHCDLKPSNIMIDAEGVAKIIDFGLARIAAEGEHTPHAPVGTPDYMAPEVWDGEAPTRRADVYSLGAVLFELLAGRPPFADIDPSELRRRVTTAEAPALRERVPDLDAGLADVIARCLRRDRNARFADGDALREALERLHASHRHSVQTGENPYRGLLPFEASHRGVFFGRRSEIGDVVGLLRGQPMVLVTGDSGVGKSSLCRAGVVPTVVDGELGGTWRALAIVPGQRPLTALASALGDPELVARLRETPASLARELRRHAGDEHGGLIVFIDQLEELFTLGDPGEVAVLDAGLAAVLDDVPGLRLLATARADFLARISTLPGLGRDLPRMLYFLRPLPPERLRDVIVGPAAAVGARFESDKIVDDLVAATAQAGSGGLPLLSFALADLWEARDKEREVISRGAVAAMGGVSGSLSRHADVVVSRMLTTERAQARNILLRLVTAMGTRARRGVHELAPTEPARKALEALVHGRLVVAQGDEPDAVYELAHECLLTDWTMLRHWLEADSADRATRERLSAAAAEWVRLGRRSDATWQGKQLDEAAPLDPASLSDSERAFVAASLRAVRRRRVQRWLAALSAIALVVLAFLTQRYLAQRALDAVIAKELVHTHEALRTASTAHDEYRALAAKAFTAFDEKRWKDGEALWQQAIAQRDAADLDYRNASGHAESAFAKDSSRAAVRDLIGDILVERMAIAEEAYYLRQRDELLDRLTLYDADESRRAARAKVGRVRVHAPTDARITLEPGGELGWDTAEVSLPPRSYALVIEHRDRVPARVPILVEPGGDLTIAVDPPHADDVPEGFIWVHAGNFLYGHAIEEERVTFFSTTPRRTRSTSAYLIARHEVTFGEWLGYVATLPREQQAAMLPGVPGKLSGTLAVTPERDPGRWKLELRLDKRRYVAGWDQRIIYEGRAQHESQDWRRFPVTGITGKQAKEYARWLDRTKQVRGARLCSEVEWERAARGADGRLYPGERALDDADANLDVTHGTELLGPDEVGLHPASISAFGLLDTCGNAFELTTSEEGGYVIRGGSYQHDRKSAQLVNRAKMPDDLVDAAVGFRLCATPPLPR